MGATCSSSCTSLNISRMVLYGTRGILNPDSWKSKPGRLIGVHPTMMRCEISHIIDSRMRNKFITFSIWSIDMQLHTLKFAPFQELFNHVWHYRGINMRNLTKRLICLEKQAFLGKKWSSENRKAHFEVEFPPHNPTFPLNGWHYRITLVLSFPMALAI